MPPLSFTITDKWFKANLKESSESDDSAKGDSLAASVGPKIMVISVFIVSYLLY
jgi:hypothetical protein